MAVGVHLGQDGLDACLGQHNRVRERSKFVHSQVFWFTSWALVMGGILERN